MVVNNIITRLKDIGLSEYEARVYTALIGTSPCTAYEIAKAAGIPTSKIYEVLSRLVEKGMASIIDSDKKKLYIPIDPDEFIETSRSKLETTLNGLKSDLSAIKSETDVSYIWNVHDYEYLMSKAERMIKGAKKTLLISGWAEEISCLKNVLKKKERTKVQIAVVHFGEIDIDTGQIFQHPIEDTIYAEKGGRGFAIVADSKEALMGTVTINNRTEGAWSMNKGFVTLAEDYIKHDIYIMKIVRRFDKSLKKRFGDKYKMLRDIFSDREA